MAKKKPAVLPLDRDDTPRFIPWIIALMVYLATLALVGVGVLGSLIDSWQDKAHSGFSVELSPAESDDPEVLIHELERQRQVLQYLSRLEGVKKTEIISKTALTSIADTWFGEVEENVESPLPTIVDVTIDKEFNYDFGILQQEISQLSPGAVVLTNREWRDGLMAIAYSIEGIGVLIASLISVAAIIISIFSTHTGLIIHHKIVEILRLLGASRAHIAKQFQDHTFTLAVRGALLGLVCSLSTLVLIWQFTKTLNLPDFISNISYLEVGIIALLMPTVLTALMILTARMTVVWSLKKLP